MKDLYRKFQLNVQNHQLFAGRQKVLIGISGGADSIVLTSLMARYFSNPEEHIILVHIDHQLREDSHNEKDVIDALGLPVEHVAWEHDDKASSGVENNAREFRYSVYEQMAKKYGSSKVALAHHANDQAETILMKLIRGGDTAQMTGMSWQRPINNDVDVIRPLLNISKSEILEYAKTNRLEWIEDITNQDSDYAARNLIRNEVLPKLESVNSNAIANIGNFGIWLSNLHENQLPEMLRIWIKEQAPNLPIKEQQLNDFARMLENSKKPHGQVELADTWRLIKQNKDIRIQKNKQ